MDNQITIPYHRCNAQTSLFKVLDILDSGNVVNGKYIRQLEQHFIDTFGVKYAVACASCTTGLIATMTAVQKLFDIETVGIPLFTWYSTWEAVIRNDTVGVPWEIDKDTWLMRMTEEGLEDVDSAIFVDTFGNMAPSLNTDKPIMYDAAHGYGLSKLGQRGIAEVVSFSFTKIVSAMQGGMILTNNDDIYKLVKQDVERFYKIEEINALVCLHSIERYEKTQLARRSVIDHYLEAIEHKITIQKETETNNSVFGILFETQELRNKVKANLDKNGVGTKIYYVPVFNVPKFKTTYNIYDKILCLPVYPELKVRDVSFICDKINEVS